MKRTNPFQAIGKPLREIPKELKAVVMKKINISAAEAKKNNIVNRRTPQS